MTIFEPLVADGYEWVNAVDDQDYEVFLSFDGQLRAGDWRPIPVRSVRADDRQAFRVSDFPWLGSDALVMRPPAVEALREILAANGEILPLAPVDGSEMFVYNARVVDGLDEEHASLVKFPGSDRIMRLKSAAFIESVVRGVDIFRLPHRASATYVSKVFVERVAAAGLRGLEFRPIWSPSETLPHSEQRR